MFPHCSVHCTEGVIQEVDVGFMIHSSGQVDPSLLATTQSHTPLTNKSQVSINQQLNVLVMYTEENHPLSIFCNMHAETETMHIQSKS